MQRHTHRRRARAVGASISAVVTLVGATVGLATPVHASADGCTHPQNFDPGSCIRVIGVGLYVESIQGGAYLFPRQSLQGHNEIRWGNVIRNTPNQVFWNQSFFVRQGVYGATIPIRATFGDGTQICSYLWKYNGGTDYTGPYGPACVTVHR